MVPPDIDDLAIGGMSIKDEQVPKALAWLCEGSLIMFKMA